MRREPSAIVLVLVLVLVLDSRRSENDGVITRGASAYSRATNLDIHT